MGTKFGDVEVTQIIENEYRIEVLEGIISLLLQRNPSGKIIHEELRSIKEAAIAKLQKKYPNSGIELTEAK